MVLKAAVTVSPKRIFPKPNIGPLIDLERNRCILCTRCVRFLSQIAGKAELAVLKRGNSSRISTFDDQPLASEFSGNIIDLCPVGALTSKITRFRTRVWELKSVSSVCTQCSVGCNVELQYRNRTHEILRIIPRENASVNHQWICDAGRFCFDQFNSDDRQRVPLLLNDEKKLQESSWSAAIHKVVDKLKETVSKHGVKSVAGIISPRQSNESLFLFQRLFRNVIGANNIDHRINRVINQNDDPYLLSVALHAANRPFEEIQKASTIMVIGADVPNEMPILHLQIRNRAGKGARVFVANSHASRMDDICANTLQYRPGMELALVEGLLYYLMKEESISVSEELKSFANKIRITKIAERTALDKKKFQEWAQALIEDNNFTILLGESILSAKYGREMVRLLAELLSSLRKNAATLPISFLLPDANACGASALGCYPHRLPGFKPAENAGKNISEILKACVDGNIKALFIMDANLLEEYPDRLLVKKALKSVPFLVVADSFRYNYTEYASVFLPLSMSSEEDGTYTNADGRVQKAFRALPQLNGSLSPVQVLLALGERWGSDFKQIPSSDVTNLIAANVSLFESLRWESLGKEGMLIKYADKSQFKEIHALSPVEDSAEEESSGSLYRLITGRNLFDTAGVKRFAGALVSRSEPIVAQINLADAAKLGIGEGDTVTVKGDAGQVKLPVSITDGISAGCISVLGKYTDCNWNEIASPQKPWVNIIR